jgi:hypothetical protein
MTSWPQDALDLFRAARARASETSNIALHRACGQAIDAMVMEVGWVPADLWSYACTVRRRHAPSSDRVVQSVLATHLER